MYFILFIDRVCHVFTRVHLVGSQRTFRLVTIFYSCIRCASDLYYFTTYMALLDSSSWTGSQAWLVFLNTFYPHVICEFQMHIFFVFSSLSEPFIFCNLVQFYSLVFEIWFCHVLHVRTFSALQTHIPWTDGISEQTRWALLNKMRSSQQDEIFLTRSALLHKMSSS